MRENCFYYFLLEKWSSLGPFEIWPVFKEVKQDGCHNKMAAITKWPTI
jgi:hypothetical protein